MDPIIALVGPTASGKSAVGARLAAALGAEVLSMDSMQVYRGMDIGTAKPTAGERALAPHHLVDVLEHSEGMTVARWLALAEEAEAAVRARDRKVMFVGGTPLYLKALLFGIFDGPEADWCLRERLAAEARALGVAALHARLAAVDPVAAARLHPNDTRRVIRAIEVAEKTGRPLTDWQREWAGQPSRQAVLLGVSRRAEDLRRRIDIRVEAMFEAGLVEEVRGLLARPGGLGREASQALGYREVAAHLGGGPDLSETRAQVKQNTRKFARRQMAWFRRFAVRWLDCASDADPEAVAGQLAKWL